jgi:hypothetical protein
MYTADLFHPSLDFDPGSSMGRLWAASISRRDAIE